MADYSGMLHELYSRATNKATLDIKFGVAYKNSPPCFFLRRELDQTLETLRASNQYRHLKIYKNGFLDYIVRKEYPTIEAWLVDCNASIDDVLFGYQKFDYRQDWIEFMDLFPQEELPAKEAETELLTSFMTKLHVNNMNLEQHVLIHTPAGRVYGFDHFMEVPNEDI